MKLTKKQRYKMIREGFRFCKECDKLIHPYVWENYAYKHKHSEHHVDYFCSWSCMRKNEEEHPPKEMKSGGNAGQHKKKRKKRTPVLYDVNGALYSYKELAEIYNVNTPRHIVYARVKLGWDVERAFKEFIGKQGEHHKHEESNS